MNDPLQRLNELRNIIDEYEFEKRDSRKIQKLLTQLEGQLGAPATDLESKNWYLKWVINSEGMSTDFRPLWPVVDQEQARLKNLLETDDVFADETMDDYYFGGFVIFLVVEDVLLSKPEAERLLEEVRDNLYKGLRKTGYRAVGKERLLKEDVQGYGTSEEATEIPEIKTWED